jgi:hypothetical protein
MMESSHILLVSHKNGHTSIIPQFHNTVIYYDTKGQKTEVNPKQFCDFEGGEKEHRHLPLFIFRLLISQLMPTFF